MSVNKVILVGNVGKDPEIRYFDNGSAVANFPIATTERGYTAANGTQIPDKTEWHNIVCWRGLAKVVEQFVKKGTQIYIEGKIRSRTYDDQNGVKRYVYEIYADNIELLGRRGDSSQADMGAGSSNIQSASSGVVNTPASTSPTSFNDAEDDLPF